MLKLFNSLKREVDINLPGFENQIEMAPYRGKVHDYSLIENKKLAAIMILLYKKEGDIYFPLIKRPEYNGHHSSQISFPGGKVELSDKDFLATAYRETEEEIGIQRTIINDGIKLTELFIPPSNFLIHPYISYINEPPHFIRDKVEVERIIEVPIDLLMNPSIVKSKKIMHSNGLKINTPYFDIDNEMVWGATAMILSEFKSILKSIKL